MKTISISVNKRTDVGKKSSKELRKTEHVPCVMYGGKEVLHFHAHENDFRHLIYSPDVFLVELDIDGDTHKAILQDIQFNPITDKIQHIDFVEAFDNKPVILNIPIELQGSAEGIKQGGKPRLKRRSLRVKGLAKDLPERLIVDITNVDVGDVIKVGDLEYPNLEILDPQRSMVYAIVSSRLALKGMELEDPDAVKEEVEEVEEVEGEEGADGGEGADGEEGTKEEGTKEEETEN